MQITTSVDFINYIVKYRFEEAYMPYTPISSRNSKYENRWGIFGIL